MLNPLGMVHGGAIATLLDTVTFGAVISVLPAGVLASTAQLNIHYTRPVGLDGGELTGVAEVTYQGSRMVTASGTITNEAGKVITNCWSAKGVAGNAWSQASRM